MGFGDLLKDIGKAVLNSAKEFSERNLEYREKYEDYYSTMSDDQLHREYQRLKNGNISCSSSQEKMVKISVLSQELRNRGFVD